LESRLDRPYLDPQQFDQQSLDLCCGVDSACAVQRWHCGLMMSEPNQLPTLDSRLALRPKEAADALGMSERKFREISSRLPAVWIDSMKLFPVEALRRWLDDQAKQQQTAGDQLANEILQEISGGRR
jgi:hypothetical protein